MLPALLWNLSQLHNKIPELSNVYTLQGIVICRRANVVEASDFKTFTLFVLCWCCIQLQGADLLHPALAAPAAGIEFQRFYDSPDIEPRVPLLHPTFDMRLGQYDSPCVGDTQPGASLEALSQPCTPLLEVKVRRT